MTAWRIYLASSWRNPHQPRAVEVLRAAGEVMDLIRCSTCGGTRRATLPDRWQALVQEGTAIPIVECGNPWHYVEDMPQTRADIPREGTPRRGALASLIATVVLSQPNALGLTADEAARFGAWMADHRGLPPGWTFRSDRRTMEERTIRAYAVIRDRMPHLVGGNLRLIAGGEDWTDRVDLWEEVNMPVTGFGTARVRFKDGSSLDVELLTEESR